MGLSVHFFIVYSLVNIICYTVHTDITYITMYSAAPSNWSTMALLKFVVVPLDDSRQTAKSRNPL